MTTLRPLGRSGLFVSPLTLGTMTFGNAGWGSNDAEDTADVYAGGASETLLGRLIAERGVRDGVVIATKYGSNAAAEVLDGLAALVGAGNIRHYGLSNVPAWFAVQVATLAQAHGLPGPIALRLEWSRGTAPRPAVGWPATIRSATASSPTPTGSSSTC